MSEYFMSWFVRNTESNLDADVPEKRKDVTGKRKDEQNMTYTIFCLFLMFTIFKLNKIILKNYDPCLKILQSVILSSLYFYTKKIGV